MDTHSLSSVPCRRTSAFRWIRRFHLALVISALGATLLPPPAAAYPHTRQGFFMGLGVATGTAAVFSDDPNSKRIRGTGGSFRLGYVCNPKFAIGLESNTWLKVEDGSAITLGTFTGAVSIFPAEGLVLRGGVGGGDVVAGGGGVSGELGLGWTIGAAYEFRVARSFAIGPQLDYSHVSVESFDSNYMNIGLSMNWYFIPK